MARKSAKARKIDGPAEESPRPTPAAKPKPAAQPSIEAKSEEDPFAVLQAESATQDGSAAAAAEDDDPTPTAAATIPTRLVLPPTEIVPVPRADTVKAGYKPADTAEGLEVVGGLGDWFSEDKDNWDPTLRYVGFGAAEKITDPALLTVCTRRALFEALALAAKGPAQLKKAWRPDEGREGLLRALGLQLKLDGKGRAQVAGDAKGVVDSLVVKESDAATPAEVKKLDLPLAEAKEIVKSWGPEWKEILLEDVKIKFAVCSSPDALLKSGAAM